MKTREKIIQDYVDAYNAFDIEKMLANLDENAKFVNISDGIVNMALIGLHSFREQAEQSRNLFSKRTQTIRSFQHRDDQTEIEIDYHGVLAVDLPDGPGKGEELALQGRSIFRFAGDKIVELTDIS